MKRVAVVVVLLAAVAAAAPYLIGWQLERDADARLNEAQARVPFAAVSGRHYARGWLSSEETLTVTLRVPGRGAAAGSVAGTPVSFSVHSTIYHGPLPAFAGVGLARIDSEVTVGTAAATAGQQRVAATAPRIETWLRFFGGGTSVAHDFVFRNVEVGTGLHLSSAPLELRARFSRHGDSVDFDGALKTLSLVADSGAGVEVRDVRLKSHGQRALRSLMAGGGSLDVGEISATGAGGDAGGRTVSVRDLHYEGELGVQGEFASIAAVLATGAVHVASTELTGARIELGYEHLHADSLEHLTVGLREAQLKSGTDGADMQAALKALWKPYGVRLVSNDPAFVIRDLEASTKDGTVKVSGWVRATGYTEKDFDPPLDMKTVLGKITVSLEVAIDTTLLEHLTAPPAEGAAPAAPASRAVVQRLLDQGYLTQSDTQTRTHLAFLNGQFTVNGRLFSPAALQPLPAPPERPAKPRATR